MMELGTVTVSSASRDAGESGVGFWWMSKCSSWRWIWKGHFGTSLKIVIVAFFGADRVSTSSSEGASYLISWAHGAYSFSFGHHCLSSFERGIHFKVGSCVDLIQMGVMKGYGFLLLNYLSRGCLLWTPCVIVSEILMIYTPGCCSWSMTIVDSDLFRNYSDGWERCLSGSDSFLSGWGLESLFSGSYTRLLGSLS